MRRLFVHNGVVWSFTSLIAVTLVLVLTLTLNTKASPPSQASLTKDEGVIVVNAENGTTLYEHNADVKMPPASITKLMTALLVVEHDDLSRIVTIGNEVAGVEGSVIGLRPGDKISIGNLLYGLLVHSGNDAAAALAVCTSGSEARFVTEMNIKGKQLGLRSTNFKNPHGLPVANHYSTARDISLIASHAMTYSVIRSIVSTREYTISWVRLNGKRYTEKLNNTNSFLQVYPGVIGMKTGTTTEAGQCLVTYAQWDAKKVIIVVLKSQNRYRDTLLYLDATYQGSQLNRAEDLIRKNRGLNF